ILQVSVRRQYGSGGQYIPAIHFIDGFWERGLKPWDIAAGIVLVKEAGGAVDEMDGGNVLSTGSVLASNGHLQDDLLKRLRRAKAFARGLDPGEG
ncbi:MAG: inositol monophosphatase family protein, partial [Pseudomonadota bacterium]